MDLNLQQVQEFINANQGNEEVKNYLQGLNKITLDGVKNYLETQEDGKGYLQSYTDSKVSKGIETFKQNNLSKLVEEEIKKRNPQDPKDLEIQELKQKFEELEKEKARESLLVKASKIAKEKNIPNDILEYFIGSDEEITMNNLTTLEKSLADYSRVVRTQILSEGSYTPKKNFNSNTIINPYAKETFSLTQQMELERNNPTLATQYKSQINR